MTEILSILTDLGTADWIWTIFACISGGAVGILAMLALIGLQAPWWCKLLCLFCGLANYAAAKNSRDRWTK